MNISGVNNNLLSEEFIYDLKQRFSVLNKKYIEYDELKKIVIELGYSPSYDEINDIIYETGNKIDFIFFLVIIGRIIKKLKSDEMIIEFSKAFDVIDINKNGTIELSELTEYIKERASISKIENNYDLSILFNSLDTNHDGYVTKDEYFWFIQHIF